MHLGFEGYRAVALDDLKNARLLSRALEGSGYYTVLSDVHRRVGGGVGDGKELGAAKGAAGFDQEDVEVCWLVGPFFCGADFVLGRIMFQDCRLCLSVSRTNVKKNIQRSSRNGSRRFLGQRDGESCLSLYFVHVEIDFG